MALKKGSGPSKGNQLTPKKATQRVEHGVSSNVEGEDPFNIVILQKLSELVRKGARSSLQAYEEPKGKWTQLAAIRLFQAQVLASVTALEEASGDEEVAGGWVP